DAALVRLLARRLERRAAPFENHDRDGCTDELAGDCDAGGAAADDADVGRETGPLLDFTDVGDHGPGRESLRASMRKCLAPPPARPLPYATAAREGNWPHVTPPSLAIGANLRIEDGRWRKRRLVCHP